MNSSGRFFLLKYAPHADVRALLWRPEDLRLCANTLQSDFHKLSNAERGEKNVSFTDGKWIFYFSSMLLLSQAGLMRMCSPTPPPLSTYFQPKTNIQLGNGLGFARMCMCALVRGGEPNSYGCRASLFFPYCYVLLFLSISPSLPLYLFPQRITYKPSVKGFMVY